MSKEEIKKKTKFKSKKKKKKKLLLLGKPTLMPLSIIL